MPLQLRSNLKVLSGLCNRRSNKLGYPQSVNHKFIENKSFLLVSSSVKLEMLVATFCGI